MWELHSARGARGDSSFGSPWAPDAASTNNNHLDTTRPGAGTELISPPQSPPHHPSQHIDTLVRQLRKQSLQPQAAPASTATLAAAAVHPPSPESLPGTGYPSPAHSRTDMAIEVDPNEQGVVDMPIPIPVAYSRFRRVRTSDRSLDSMVSMLARRDQCHVRSAQHGYSPFASNQVLTTAARGSRPAQRDIRLEADEGFCEDDARPSNSGDVTPLRAASGPGGISKDRVMQYRRSIQAAGRCPNLVMKKARMRRRDKPKPSSNDPLSGRSKTEACPTTGCRAGEAAG